MSEPMLIIAEAGVNHNGDLERAKAMVDAAAQAGADLVKFQAFDPDSLLGKNADAAAYQQRNTGVGSQEDLLRGLALDMTSFAALARCCRDAGIGFLCTPFAVEATGELLQFGMDYIKVASGELTNTPALQHFASFGKPVILSTGMSTLDEVRGAVAALDSAGCVETILLHCTSIYPAPPRTLNLRAIQTLQQTFHRRVGFSDHSLGDGASIAAAALGATVIEKHFTLDRALPGPDQKASLEPNELAAMISKLRDISAALGDGVKQPQGEEIETAKLVRRSWHARRVINAGETITSSDIALKRPAAGLPPDASPAGRRIKRDRDANDPITAEDLA